MKNSLRRGVWLIVTVAVLGVIIYHLSRSKEWRDFNWSQFWLLLVHVRPGYLLAALAATYSSYLLRAYRWQLFLLPIKRASLWVLFVGQILGFSSIYLVGRLGEFVRPAYIARKEEVRISSMVAIWTLERAYDTVLLLLLFVATLLLAGLDPVLGRAGSVLRKLDLFGLLGMLVVLVLVPALVVFRFRAEAATNWIVSRCGFLGVGSRHHLGHFLNSFAEGLKVIHNLRDLAASIIVTVVLWTVNGSVFWFVFQGLGGEVARLSWLGAALTMFFAVIGLVAQLPGIGGGYQVLAGYALTGLFGVRGEEAAGAAILTWIMISVPCLALGVVLLIREGLTFRRLEAIAEEERAAVEEEV